MRALVRSPSRKSTQQHGFFEGNFDASINSSLSLGAPFTHHPLYSRARTRSSSSSVRRYYFRNMIDRERWWRVVARTRPSKKFLTLVNLRFSRIVYHPPPEFNDNSAAFFLFSQFFRRGSFRGEKLAHPMCIGCTGERFNCGRMGR